jgi:glyoxylase-like metal-dependent hydrolase (beta-lactamase superfamily II)
LTQQLKVGDVTVLPVLDSTVGGPPRYLFPGVSEERFAPYKHFLNADGRLEFTIGTYVLRSAGKTLLVDTGIGGKDRPGFPAGNLLENLAEAGVRPEDVDVVVITHLHIDHVGWNTVERDGQWVTTFPRASYVVVKDEWDFFSSDPVQSKQEYVIDSVLPLAGSGQLELVDREYAITPELTLVPSPGHTPAHSCVALVSRGEKAMILGDLTHHPLQLTETEWEAVFDLDRALACKSREAIARRIEEEGAYAIGGHFPTPGFGRLLQLDGRRVWQAI